MFDHLVSSYVWQLLFSGEETSLLYPCHSLVVDLEVSSGRQRFFIGHTDKVGIKFETHCSHLIILHPNLGQNVVSSLFLVEFI